jgi:pimeloyl-ACP methyl ester carboxylesterase
VTGPVALYHEIEGDGPPLVLLHGGAGTGDDLAALRARLVATRRVISPEQRGHGRTPFSEPFTYAAMATDTAALLERVAAEPADVVGWSDGALVALVLGRDRPDLVRRVVAIGINVNPEPGVAPRQAPGPAEWLAAATPADLPMADGYRASPDGVDRWPAVAARLLELWRAPSGFTLADLARLQAPLLIVVGDRDLFPLEDVAAMARTSGADLAVVPHAGHDVPQSQPDLVATLVDEFFART